MKSYNCQNRIKKSKKTCNLRVGLSSKFQLLDTAKMEKRLFSYKFYLWYENEKSKVKPKL